MAVSMARHHTEWLSLVEISGPFLSMPVLVRAFPQGLDAHDPEQFQNLRLAYEEWEDNQGGLRPDPAIHQAWTHFVLQHILELPDTLLLEDQALPPGLQVSVAEQHEVLRPSAALANPPDGLAVDQPRLLIQVYPRHQSLDGAVESKHWKASPGTRMMEVLHASGVRLGLVTNGEQWMLVDAPRGETTGFVSWYASLWLDEPVTLRAFRSLLGVRRFFGVPSGDTIEALLAESAQDQSEVTTQLGEQVRRAVELLVQALDRADKDTRRTLLRELPESILYEAALTVMMRLVFLMSAEERKLLLLGEPLYDQFYAVSTLRAQLREAADQYGEEILERRYDAWCRILATFRAVHAGVEHETMRLPAYGGHLFDPDRFPFLEGRPVGVSWTDEAAEPLPIHNRTVLHLLEALQILQVKAPGGGRAEARRLSFRALDVEQIGHVYEILLGYTARRATEPLLGLAGAKDRNPVVSIAALQAAQARGEGAFLAVLKEATGRSESALRRALATQSDLDVFQKLQASCDNDTNLVQRILPFAPLLDTDTNGYPVVITEGSTYIGEGLDRESTQTHYTPRSLTEPIVRFALEPLVYMGPAEGAPENKWLLRRAEELLDLKICDPAMGSGAFLVQACRYLAERLVEAWEEAEQRLRANGVTAPAITPYGDLASGEPTEFPIPTDSDERLALARRIVSDRCLYGVDKNPMAVEMAKLSLWLVTLDKGRPFTFVDHALRCGDSLLGIDRVAQLERFHLDTGGPRSYPFFGLTVQRAFHDAVERRRTLESFTVRDIHDAAEKERLLEQAERAVEDVRVVADLLVGATLSVQGARGRSIDEIREGAATSDRARDRLDDRLALIAYDLERALDLRTNDQERPALLAELRTRAGPMLDFGQRIDQPKRRPFHWLLDFPEVFAPDKTDRIGFDALLGNPPFLGGKKISGTLGTSYREYLVEYLASGARGNADLCAFFFLRAFQLIRQGGMLGILATNTIAQGDTREVGLEQIVAAGRTITRAVASRKWPGTASLEVAHVWIRNGAWAGSYFLDEIPVHGITPLLTLPGDVLGKPYPLVSNAELSYVGSFVLGMGFVLAPEDAQSLVVKNPRNRDVVFPYINGEDVNSRPDQSASRWVINFFDWPECVGRAKPNGHFGASRTPISEEAEH